MRVLFLLLLLSSCGQFIETLSDNNDELNVTYSKDQKVSEISLVFSHNINGETHPCGCRNFPLGGIPQVAGALESIKKKGPLIYLDSGDLLFPTVEIPHSIKKSSTFIAKNIFKSLSDLGLKVFVPGDQDFANGADFLKKVVNKSDSTVLLGNAKKKIFKKQTSWTKFTFPPHKIYLTSILALRLTSLEIRNQFQPPRKALKEIINLMKKDGYSPENPFHRLVLISHSGIKSDRKLAKEFPQIDWIIGAHSSTFTKDPFVVGDTKIVQVLSRNHYLGHIKFNLSKSKKSDSFKLIQIHQDLENNLKPNPYNSFLIKHKEELKKIQLNEQEEMNLFTKESSPPLRTFASCVDCHVKQGEHWKGTPHSLAYGSLLKTNEEANLKCLKCHSLGLNQKGGYKISKNIIEFHKRPLAKNISTRNKKDLTTINEKKLSYLSQLRKILTPIKSIRALTPNARKKYISKWIDLDEKNLVKFNFSNVQCLHCHNQKSDHPFTIDSDKKKLSKIDYVKKCLTCHTDDQSPSWYQDKKPGEIAKFNPKLLKSLVKKIACPSL